MKNILLLLVIVGWIGCKGDGESKESVRLYNDSILRWIDSFGVSPLDTIVYRRSMLIDTTSGLDYKWESLASTGSVRPAREEGWYDNGRGITIDTTTTILTDKTKKITTWTDAKAATRGQAFVISPIVTPADTIYIYRDTCTLRGVRNGSITVLYVDDNGVLSYPSDTIIYKHKQ